jgi:Ala-tRNA(Pro) deacylase
MATTVLDRLIERLNERQIPHEVLHHDPVFTSEEAARVRGTTLASGAKALICKADGQFILIVLPADRRLASKQLRKAESIRSLRFANREEVDQLTGLQPGSIPPFGSLFDLPTWCDASLALQPTINFNAGDHTVSISMQYADFEALEQPRCGQFAE